MIRSEHVREDLKKIEETKEVTLKEVAHVMSLIAKILLDVRQNQVAIMEKQGIKLRTGKKKTPKAEDEE